VLSVTVAQIYVNKNDNFVSWQYVIRLQKFVA